MSRRVRGLVAVVMFGALFTLGCSGRRTDGPGQCLPLNAAVRSELTADPAGGALYWFEPVRVWDFDAELRSYLRLVRFDLDTRELTPIADHVLAPMIFTREGIVVRQQVGDYLSLGLVDHTGQVHSLLPDFMAPMDAEPIDDHTIAVLARGGARRAVYVLDLDHPRPRFLIEADTLLSVAGTKVFTRKDEDGISVDLTTGERRKFALPAKLYPQGSDLWYVVDKQIHVRSMTTGEDHTVPAPAENWKLVHQYGHVLARTSQKGGASHSRLLRHGEATTLADVRDDVTVLEATVDGDQTWALIGHNTLNYDGDIGDTSAESDVCVLPTSLVGTFRTHSVPERFLDREAALFTMMRILQPKATVQVMDAYGEPTSVLVDVPDRGGMDLEAMRQRARFFHERVTSILGDREIRTDVQFSDGRIAHVRWRRERLGTRATAGMGPGLIADLASYPLELQQGTAVKDAGRIACSGTLVNLRPLPLVNVQVRCIQSDRKRVIEVGTLPPGGAATFSESYEVADDSTAELAISVHDDPVDYLDRIDEERNRKVFELGVAIYDATKLAIESKSIDDEIYVELRAPRAFDSETEAQRLTAVTEAYRQLQALRPIYKLDDATKLSLHVIVRQSTITYDYDGDKLTDDD